MTEQRLPEEILAGMPDAVRAAVEQRNGPALDMALGALPEAEQASIIAALEQAGILKLQSRRDLFAMLPESIQAALAQQNVDALERALAALPDTDRQATMVVLQQIETLLEADITPEDLVALLPAELQLALRNQDSDGFKAAFDALSSAEQEDAAAIVQRLQELAADEEDGPTPEQLELFRTLPPPIQAAVASSDHDAFHAAMGELSEPDQQRIIEILMNLNILQV